MAIRSEMPPDEHRTALTIPRGPEDVTPEWLREAMTRGGGRLPTYIADVRWTRVATGLLGNVVRLHLTYAGEAKGAPSTVIMKCGAPTPVARQLNRSQAYYKKEITFYERVATSGGVHVPSCYFTAYDAETGSGVLLLEDIVDGRSVHEVEGCVAAELIAAVGAIVSFHSKWWDSAVSEFGFPAWNDEPGYSALYAQVRKWFTEFYARYPENRTVAELGPKLVAFYPQVVAHVAKPPLSLCHSDYRLANVLFVGAGACLKGCGLGLAVDSARPCNVRRRPFSDHQLQT
jgi:hypothetical protein